MHSVTWRLSFLSLYYLDFFLNPHLCYNANAGETPNHNLFYAAFVYIEALFNNQTLPLHQTDWLSAIIIDILYM
jgi:hypothetical protein